MLVVVVGAAVPGEVYFHTFSITDWYSTYFLNLLKNRSILIKMQNNPFVTRTSTSPFISRIWQANFTHNGELTVTANGTWDMIFGRLDGTIGCIITGPTTEPVRYQYHAGQWALGIQFKPGVYLPGLPAREVINTSRSLKDDGKLFWLKGLSFRVPDFDTAEQFVDQLHQHKLLARDVVVERTLEKGKVAGPKRSVQRHFANTTGLPLSRHQQIARAHKAAELLRAGLSITQVVHDCDYYDQAHLTRSLKQFLGTTPGQVEPKR
jgi:AraC-like DNA-binding protein